MFLCMACAPETSSHSEVSQKLESSIIDGALVTSRATPAAKSVVYLEFFDKNKEVISYCSGALISANFVLTAAHCFDPKVVPNVKGFNVVFENRRIDVGLRKVRQGVDFKVHPRYNSTPSSLPLFDHDIAVAMFRGIVPSEFAPVPIDTDTTANYANENVYVYGYGRVSDYNGDVSDYGSGGSGYLRRGIMKVSSAYTTHEDRYFTNPQSPTFLCQGDSGGPQFYDKNKKLRIVGVNSAVWGKALPNGKQTCRGTSQATKVATFSSWILSEQQKMWKQLN